LHGTRYEHFPGRSRGSDTRPDVHSDAAQLVADQLAFARVHARPYIHAESSDAVGDGASATDTARGTVKGSEEAIAGGVDLAPALTAPLLADHPVIGLQEVRPSPIADVGRALGGPDDVGEHHGSQHTIVLGGMADARQKLLDLADEGFPLAEPPDMVVSSELHQSGSGNPRRHVTA